MLDGNDIDQRFPHSKKFLKNFFVVADAPLVLPENAHTSRKSSAISGQRRSQRGLWGLA